MTVPVAKVGDDLRFEAFYVESGARVTGLTVTVDIYRNDTKILDDQPVTESGDGLYTYTLDGATYNTVVGNYVAIFNTAGSVDQADIPSLWVVGPVQAASAIEFTYTVTNSVTTNPIQGAVVQISTDATQNNILWTGVTNNFGIAVDTNSEKPFLTPGTYYFWTYKAGFSFVNPDTEVVS